MRGAAFQAFDSECPLHGHAAPLRVGIASRQEPPAGPAQDLGQRQIDGWLLKVLGWIWRDTTQEQRDAALLEQTGRGTDGPTSGLIGYPPGRGLV